MSEMPTLVEVLCRRARETPDDVAYVFLADGEHETERWTYAQLAAAAGGLARRLEGIGARGERVLLLYPSGLPFVAAFLGCLAAGAVAVPALPPRRRRANDRLRSIVDDCAPSAVLSTAAVRGHAGDLAEEIPALAGVPWLATDEAAEVDPGGEQRTQAVAGSDLAFLQYTSGSTADPKGVEVTHANLAHNEAEIAAAFGCSAATVVVSWLPLYHDMGLIGGVLQPLWVGGRAVLMSPAAFLQRPARWLEAISRYRATVSGGPDFAYDLCARRVSAEERAGLDLSAWRVAFDGSEPVRAESLDRFASAFGVRGFARRAFFPCYGLAEATLFVTGGDPGREPPVVAFDTAGLETRRAVPEAGGRRLVGCGRRPSGRLLAIVDPETARPLGDGEVGEVWVGGPSVASGYWRRPAESAETFGARLGDGTAGPFLRTGDLGFLHGGELYLCGRIKDLVILRGRNLHPQDLEATATAAHPDLRPGGGVAFSIEARDGERLVIVHEVERRAASPFGEVADAVRRRVAEEHEADVHEVVLVRPATVPKTSSGKLRRRFCRQLYLEGGLAVLERHGTPERRIVAEGSDAAGEALGIDPTALDGYLRRRLARLGRHLEADEAAVLPDDVPLVRLLLDSLAVVELSHRLAADLGIRLDPAGLLDGLTLGELRAEIERALDGADAPEHPPPATAAWDGSLTDGQRALYLLEGLEPGVYNLATAARVGPELQADTLERAWAQLVARHPLLRSIFPLVDGEPVRHALDGPPAGLEVVDAGGWDQAALLHRLREAAREPFDLGRGPLWRLVLFRRTGGDGRLLLGLHHLIGDFWSLGVLVRELADRYSALLGAADAAEEGPPPADDYGAWAAREQIALEGTDGARWSAFWRRELGSAPTTLELPTDRPRPSRQSFRGAAVAGRLGAGSSERLEAFARRTGATLLAVLLAAWQAQLARVSGQREVLVGVPAANRDDPGLADVVGYCVNPVVLRGDLRDEPSFATLIERARERLLRAFAHQRYPFPRLAGDLLGERDPARSPLFQAMLVLQSPPAGDPRLAELPAFALGSPGARLELGELTLVSESLEPWAAAFDLTLTAARLETAAGSEVLATLTYCSDLFDRTTARRLLDGWRRLLSSGLGSPERAVSELGLLSAAESHQLLHEANAGESGPSAALLHAAFLEQARLRPEAVALRHRGSVLSYGELRRRSGRVARSLAAQGVGPESRVGIHMGRTPELVACLLGVLESGAAYLPLDPSWPAERRRLMLEDSGSALVVAEDPSELPAGSSACRPSDLSVGAGAEPVGASPGGLAYVIYTSGSTGRPKGVAIEHGAASALVSWAGSAFAESELSGVLAATSICFDLSVFELFVPLSMGGTVVLCEQVLDLSEGSAVPPGSVRLVNTVPSAMVGVLESGALPSSVTAVCLAGEALLRPLVDRLLASGRVSRVWNLYGPTEHTTYATGLRVESTPGAPTIGVPLSGDGAYVVDWRGMPCPWGVYGELLLGGAGLARGYLGRASLTAERFVPHAWSDRGGSRLYRTGDLARWLASGELELGGRLDRQVKVRGFRIEPGEVERRLLDRPGVSEAAVVVSFSGDRLQAFVVVSGVSVSGDWLRSELSSELPSYLVPSWVEVVPSLPRTPSGKVDRGALSRRSPSSAEQVEGSDSPRTAAEGVVSSVFAEVLGVAGVGRETSFFALGGHSLLAARLLSRLREALGVELPLSAVFEAPTPAALAARAEAERGSRPAAIELVPVAAGAEPLSPAQRRLWIIDRLKPGNAAYNLPAALTLDGRLRPAVLEAALGALLERHEALRTVFPSRAGRPRAEVQPPRPFELPAIDLSDLAEAARRRERERLEGLLAARGFDLARGPLLRAFLLCLSGHRHQLVINVHHVVFDGWSAGVMARDLGVFYGAFVTGRPAVLEPLPFRYADYAGWQERWLASEDFVARLAAYRRRLGDAPELLRLPTDRPRPAVQRFRGRAHVVRLGAGLTGRLEALARHRGATLFMVLLTAFQAQLARFAGQDDFTVGSPSANRDRPELEGLIGFFVNVLVLRADLGGDPTFTEALARVRASTLDAFEQRAVPFESLVEALEVERDASRNPLFQVLFALQNTPAVRLELEDLSLSSRPLPTGAARFDLALSLGEDEGGLAGELEHDADLFDATTAARLAGWLERSLEAVVEAPDRRLSTLPRLAAGERHALLVEWDVSPEPASRAAARRLHRRLEARATTAPEAIAVVHRGAALSYGELHRRAEKLARRLRSLGVGPEVRVGLVLGRSPALPMALLAVLKAGGAYVPLDASFPAERLRWLVRDAGVRLLLTEEAVLAERATLHADLGETELRMVVLEREAAVVEALPAGPLDDLAEPFGVLADGLAEHRAASGGLAYVLYTSGSTGRPKGVMVSHANVVSFFDAMGARFGPVAATWLAVTGVGFDISVLELLWTLERGDRVVIQEQVLAVGAPAADRARHGGRSTHGDRGGMAFSLFYFAAGDGGEAYRLLIEGARIADRHGLSAVWTPERHFHPFGGPYPNPAVTGAAVAAVTERVAVRAGSVVLPLHDPLRVAEEWAVVDNLSRGRVGISFASGWYVDDFALAPDRFAERHRHLEDGIETVRRLWRGEKVRLRNGAGAEVELGVFPRPVQSELPVWLTAAGDPATFELAGRLGVGVLSHLLTQSVEELETKIARYRHARREAGHPGPGQVSLMLHTFVERDAARVAERAREPLRRYLASSLDLLRSLAAEVGLEAGGELKEAEVEAFLDVVYERFVRSRALLGTLASCRPLVARLAEIGVDEVACLIDFGVAEDDVLASLEVLVELRDACRDLVTVASSSSAPGEAQLAEPTLAEQVVLQRVSHLQTTPSTARLLAADGASRAALGGLERLLLGGEALPPELAAELAGGPEVHNVYGPTETTIWSVAHRLGSGEVPVPIGWALAGTRLRVIDRHLHLQGLGVPGELAIGGPGVTRGYLGRPALTAERYVPDPWAPSGARLYRTGDRVRRRADGTMLFLGRLDHQVKVGAHRIEPGEVEAVLRSHPGVREAVVVARREGRAARLVAFYTVEPAPGLVPRLDAGERAALFAEHRRFTLPGGLEIAHLGDFQTSVAYREVFTDAIYLRRGIDLAPGGVVFDVGANVGLFSLFICHHRRPGRIFAFEPIPATFEVLSANARLYGLDAELFRCGLAERPGRADFTFYPHMAGLSSRHADVTADRAFTRSLIRGQLAQGEVQGLTVTEDDLEAFLDEQFEAEIHDCELRTLSEVIDEHGVERIDLLKIDVERAELEVVAGIRDEHWSRIAQVVAEVDGREHLEALRSQLEGHGFEVAADDFLAAPATGGTDGADGAEVFMLYARRPDLEAPPPTPAAPPEAAELRAHLAARLPAHMVPSAFVTLDELPMTANRKVDRVALAQRELTAPPAPAQPVRPAGLPAPAASPVAPATGEAVLRGELESLVAGVWRRALSLDSVSRDDNFFEIGGSSLLLAEVHASLQVALGREIPLLDVFRHPTVASLAEHLGGGRQEVSFDDMRDRGRQQTEARRLAPTIERQRRFMAARQRRRRPGSDSPAEDGR